MAKVHKVRLDKQRTRELVIRYARENGTVYRELPDKLGIGKDIIRQIMDDTNVDAPLDFTPRIVRLLARELRTTFSDLCSLDVLPPEKEFYESLKYSYYVDHRRDKLHRLPYWRFEEAEFKFHKKIVIENGGVQLRFKMRLKNADKVVMNGLASRNTGSHFVVTVGGCNEKNIAFDAGFARVFDGVLCGVWIGVDPVGCPTVYRMLLSPKPLNADDIARICSSTPVHFAPTGSFKELSA